MSAAPTANTGLIETDQHGMKAHSDGGDAYVPVQSRAERFTSTSVDDFEKVTGFELEWKLTPISRIAALTEGELDGSAPATALPEGVAGVAASWVDRSDARIGTAGAPEERASANAWSSFEKALAIDVSGEELHEYRVIRSELGQTPRAAHTVITAAPFSQGLVILSNSGDAQLSENVEIVVGDQAQLTVVTVQEWTDESNHLASHFARVGRDARLRHIVISLGGGVVRVNPSIHLVETGADGSAFGAYFADAGQHLEQRVYIDHVAAQTKSRVKYKGALQGATARSVWVGDVLIGPHATGTDSYEENRNLVLSEGPRADSIPNLEIETGDIQGAGHASSTGRFDDEQLFYLQSRGIPEDEARRLVVRGFLAEIVAQIGSEQVESELSAAIEAELTRAQGI
ncbi:Fe-S cluster assembly protein SufD [Agreia sp. VKM Ac-1783]|uniref:Fe-S cluster assembly protein SufD n=1 Tax=Agreia sp. VKM Ac-1783 TaxID=1938889 RepID=UPI000A2AD100|nr:Fe-S cluster assembly protein SufD [Agreia sp. VKM Ac-1783]SMQ67628.1 Iron-regulated ABC transporter permease protein SufD [Agreia sp. VKM Ac-1783]